MILLNIHKEKIGAFLFLVFSVAYGIATYHIPLMFYAEEEAFTARTLPTMLCCSAIIVAIAMLILPPVSDVGDQDNSFWAAVRGLEWRNVSLLILLMIVYGLTIKAIGFILSTILFLMAGFWILGERRPKYLILVSVPLVLVFWAIMTKLLEVYLAPGNLFFFLGE